MHNLTNVSDVDREHLQMVFINNLSAKRLRKYIGQFGISLPLALSLLNVKKN
jgi:hypothetical protein